MKNSNYMMDHILYQIFNIILKMYLKSMRKRKSISKNRYKKKIENRVTFKIETGYYLELLTPETMKLLRSTKSKITKEKNVKMFLI